MIFHFTMETLSQFQRLNKQPVNPISIMESVGLNMKVCFLFVLLFVTCFKVSAQAGSWRIKLQEKVLLSTEVENEQLNSFNLSTKTWAKKGYLEISFKEAEKNIWKRSFLFFDENDREILAVHNRNYYKISTATLRRLFKGKKELRVYTIVSPIDPAIAVRVRRVHLCTFRLP